MRKSCLFLFIALSLCLLIACNPDVVQETKYTVRYVNTDNNCGTIAVTSSGETSAGSTVVLPSATANAGYTFSGWYTASEGGTKAGDAGASYTVTANTTLYARWTANTYTIAFDKNNISATGETADITTKYTDSVILSNSYEFTVNYY